MVAMDIGPTTLRVNEIFFRTSNREITPKINVILNKREG